MWIGVLTLKFNSRMAGHSRWAQVKHKKAITDAKKGQLFSKIIREITVAAKTGGPNPETNPRLRSALDRAREIGLPKENAERAISRAGGSAGGTDLFEFLFEATAGGVQILIEGITDNKNRTLAEIKKILTEHGAKFVPSGSLLWNFEKIWTPQGKDYLPKTSVKISTSDRERLVSLLDKLTEHADVQEVYTNLKE